MTSPMEAPGGTRALGGFQGARDRDTAGSPLEASPGRASTHGGIPEDDAAEDGHGAREGGLTRHPSPPEAVLRRRATSVEPWRSSSRARAPLSSRSSSPRRAADRRTPERRSERRRNLAARLARARDAPRRARRDAKLAAPRRPSPPPPRSELKPSLSPTDPSLACEMPGAGSMRI